MFAFGLHFSQNACAVSSATDEMPLISGHLVKSALQTQRHFADSVRPNWQAWEVMSRQQEQQEDSIPFFYPPSKNIWKNSLKIFKVHIMSKRKEFKK